MRALIPAIVVGLALLVAWLAVALYLRSTAPQAMTDELAARHERLKRVHQCVIGVGIVLYGFYLSTLTGTTMRWVLPGIGAIGGGAAAGAGIGFLTYLAVGTVGVVTGGVGIALGAAAMTLIGSGVGAVSAATGGFGYRAVVYPLVTPWFWGPTIILGLYVIRGAGIRRAGGAEKPHS